MIVTYQMTGRLSNNLIEYIHYDTFCKENNISYYNPDFLMKHANKYPKMNRLRNKIYFFPLWLLCQIIRIRILGFQPFGLIFDIINFHTDEDLHQIDQLHKKKGLVFVRGFAFRQPESVEKQKIAYRDLFQPSIDKELMLSKYFHNQFDQLYLAVHIRRGDYSRFLGGKYFFDDENYSKWIKEFIALQTKPVKVILFTNDSKLNQIAYKDFDFVLSKQNPIEDHFLMSQCDYIIGPPSTFSIWASFMGEKPLLSLNNKNQKLIMCDFKISNS